MTVKQLSDNDIIHFLTENSDFFVRHPEQLEALRVSNTNGTVTSLVNHQVNVLKERNNNLKKKLSELIQYAAENEKTMSQVFELTLQLCQISHVANVTKHLGKFVKKHFDSDEFKLVLPNSEGLENTKCVLTVKADQEQYFISVFNDFIKGNKPLCGRLKNEKLKFIFSNSHEKIGSSVILPIGKNAQKGLMIFASYDDSHFNPDMSTDILSKLTEILDRKLNYSFKAIKALYKN